MQEEGESVCMQSVRPCIQTDSPSSSSVHTKTSTFSKLWLQIKHGLCFSVASPSMQSATGRLRHSLTCTFKKILTASRVNKKTYGKGDREIDLFTFKDGQSAFAH